MADAFGDGATPTPPGCYNNSAYFHHGRSTGPPNKGMKPTKPAQEPQLRVLASLKYTCYADIGNSVAYWRSKRVTKDKDDARAEGFKRGLGGKAAAAGLLQGWTDDKAAGVARNEGYVAGGRERTRLAATKNKRKK